MEVMGMKVRVVVMKAVMVMKAVKVTGLLLAVDLFVCFCPALHGRSARQHRKCLPW